MIDRHLMMLTSLAKEAHRFRPVSCSGCGRLIPAALGQRPERSKKPIRCSCGLLKEQSSYTA